MSWWNKAKDAVNKAGKDIKAEADRLADRLKNERDKVYPYLLTQKPAEKHYFSATKMNEIIAKRNLYFKLARKVVDKNGTFQSINNCDGAMFDSMSSYAGFNIDIEKLYMRGGRLYRHAEKDCLDDSGSTVSNDMIIGFMFYLIGKNKSKLCNDYLNKLIKSKWIAGDSIDIKNKVSKAFVKPATATVLSHVNRKLGNRIIEPFHSAMHVFSPTEKGYVRHLQALYIALYGLTDNKISLHMLKVVTKLVRENPKNVLHQFNYAKWVTGNFEPVYSLLTNGEYWPHGRLPTSADRKEKWLPERNESEYTPNKSKNVTVWSGMDYCFIVKLMESEGL